MDTQSSVGEGALNRIEVGTVDRADLYYPRGFDHLADCWSLVAG
jgi:hypothetical protein